MHGHTLCATSSTFFCSCVLISDKFQISKISDAEARDKISEPRAKGASRPGSKAQSRDVSRPPSAIENNIDYFKEPVVKVRLIDDQ